jgi:hypothetical protein
MSDLPSVAGPPFFIVGSARSGTTLLRLMLNAHRAVAVPPESRFITELWRGQKEIEVEDLLARLSAHKRFEAWDLPVEAIRDELNASATADYASVIEAGYKAYARVHGKTKWGDKTPRYVEHIPFIAGLWPKARFIHLIRDGRNVALSYADVPFGPKNIAQAAQLWATRVERGCTDGRALEPGRYLEIRYEDLVEDAAGEAKDLCEFLDLEFDPGMLDYTERARDAVLSRASRFNPHLTEKPVANTRSWAKDMPNSQVEIFEAVAGDVLSLLGYERRFENPGVGARIGATFGKFGLPVGRLK